MQSKTPKIGMFLATLVGFNAIIAATVHPFNLLGVMVMNVTAIVVAVVGLRLTQARSAKL